MWFCSQWAFSQTISHLRNEGVGLRNGTHVPRGGFAAAKHPTKFRNSFRSTLRSCVQTAITSSFQLRFAHRLKRWTSDFPSFETIYGMYKMDSRKYSKCVLRLLSLVHVRFLSLISSLHSWFGFGKGLRSSKAWILHVFELQLGLPWTIQSSPSFLACFSDKKAIKNTKT